MQDLALHIIASSPDYALHLPTATTTSLFVKSAVGREFLSKAHSIILEGQRHIHPWASITVWIEAIDIVQHMHVLPKIHFGVIPGHFSLPLSKLEKTLNSLSPTDPGKINFRYLDSLSRDWNGAEVWRRSELVGIISEHINKYQSNAKSSHCPGKSKISPLVMSPAGLDLITFVNNRLAEEQETWRILQWSTGGGTRWRDAMARVRAAYPELPPDQFKHIYQKGIDPPTPRECPPQQEAEAEAQTEEPDDSSRELHPFEKVLRVVSGVYSRVRALWARDRLPSQQPEVRAQAEDPGDTPKDVECAREVRHDDREMSGRSNLGPSPQPESGDQDRSPLVEVGDEKGSISRQRVMPADPASGSTSGSRQGVVVVGGLGAYKNV
ncbi:hypothetical protein PM082_011071 [Marasmius tenuissimus]|nr:hypothetical protein PM082_011071 [Marasmius tenuissimus]